MQANTQILSLHLRLMSCSLPVRLHGVGVVAPVAGSPVAPPAAAAAAVVVVAVAVRVVPRARVDPAADRR